VEADSAVSDYSAEQRQRALRPLASLISKSEKVQQKLAPQTWQRRMLAGNLEALRTAMVLMGPDAGAGARFSDDALATAIGTLSSLIERVEATEATFAPGTSPHTLQRNRLEALRIARAVVEAELGKR
jgi:hypothetical protein